jgi:hypothetical protein
MPALQPRGGHEDFRLIPLKAESALLARVARAR